MASADPHRKPPIRYTESYMPHTMFHPIMLKIISANEFQKLSPSYSDSSGQHISRLKHAMPYFEFSRISKRTAALSATKKDVSGEVNHTVLPKAAPHRMCANAQTSIWTSVHLYSESVLNMLWRD